MAYVIEMLDITKSFPGIRANDHVTLQVEQGSIHALLGENGAGKSTLMSILFGLYQPDSGSIKVRGKEVRITESQRRQRPGHRHGPPALQARAQLHRDREHHPGPRAPLRPGHRPEGRRQAGPGDLGALRPQGRSRRQDRGHLRGHAAAGGDPQDALPRRRDPHLRRTHRRADAAGDPRAHGHHAPPRAGGQDHPAHHPQAQGDQGSGRPLHGAAPGQAHRHGARGRHLRGSRWPR